MLGLIGIYLKWNMQLCHKFSLMFEKSNGEIYLYVQRIYQPIMYV